MTPLQKQVLATVIRATHAGQWYRAASSGERVTLASLYYKRLLDRRAWRGVEGQRDAAHEYRAAEPVLVTVRELRAPASGSPARSSTPADAEVDPSSGADASGSRP